jgi:hypothetical protein
MKKIIFGVIIAILMVACAGNAIIREYKYSYKMKNAEDVLYDVVTIVENNDMALVGNGNTRQSINTTHGMFFVDVVETEWTSIGISNESGNEYELKYRIWVPVEGSIKKVESSNLQDSFSEAPEESMFSENVVSIESFIRIMEKGEYKIKEAIPRDVFALLEKIPIEISGVLEHVGLSNESKIRLETE